MGRKANIQPEVLLRSRQLYKRKRFRLALEILESHMPYETIPLDTRHNVRCADHNGPISETDSTFSVYELRAALYEREGQLNRARHDATAMIRLKPNDARGYLRLGRVLQQMLGRMSDAVDVYRDGLRTVSDKLDASYILLEKLERAAAAKLEHESRIRCDPVATLPRELLYQIFQLFELRRIVQLLLVSRAWRDYLQSEPRFWSNLVFEPANTGESNRNAISSPVSAEAILKYITFAGQHDLEIDTSAVVIRRSEKVLERLAQGRSGQLVSLNCSGIASLSTVPLCRSLRNSSSQSFSRLRQLTISSESLDTDLTWCLEHLPALEELSLSSTARNHPAKVSDMSSPVVSPLRKLTLIGRCGSRVLTDSLATKVASIPTLESLDMHRIVPFFSPVCDFAITSNRILRRFGFTSEGVAAKRTPVPCPQFASPLLESLTLNNLFLFLVGERQALPLTYLELKNVRMSEPTLTDLLVWLGCTQTLETLVIHQAALVEPISQPIHLPILDTLQFTGMHSIDDVSFQCLLSSMPALRKANFDGTALTGPKLLRLVEHGLRVVRCRGIQGVSSDTVLWLRNHPHVRVFF